MGDTDVCFPFIELPPRPRKPRSRGITVVSDRSLAGQEAKNLLESSSELIDYVKFTDHAANLGRHSTGWMRVKTAIYREHGIKVFPGGIVFEVAVLQGKVEPLMERLVDLGFSGVEISEDAIPPLPKGVRASCVAFAQQVGLEVFTEIGKKDPTAPLDAQEAIAAIQSDIEMGAKKVAVENSDIALLMKGDPDPLYRIVKAVGIEPLVFEIGPHGYPQTLTWVIRSFGPEVNLENLYPDQLAIVEACRLGLNRAVNYEFLGRKGGRPAGC
jgi:phosphosulfolactate synthase